MRSSDLVSVCIPVLNGREFILDCLQSISLQKYDFIEVLISDDGSKDNSVEYIKNVYNELDISFPLRIFYNKGLGISGNCNYLARKANGNFIKFLFQDDTIEPNFISEHIKYINKCENISFSFSNRKILNESDNKTCHDIEIGCSSIQSHWTIIKSIQSGMDLLEDPRLLIPPYNKIGEPSNVIILRDKFLDVGGFDNNLQHLLDLDLWFSLMTCGNVVFIDKQLSTFRLHEKQASVQNINSDLIGTETINLLRKFLEDNKYRKLSSKFKYNVVQELIRVIKGDRIPRKDFVSISRVCDELKEEIDGNLKQIKHNKALIQKQEKHIDLLRLKTDQQKQQNHQQQEILSKKIERISFMENTFVWKFRRKYMKFYYLYKFLLRFCKKEKKSISNKKLNFNRSIVYNEIIIPSFSSIEFSIIIPFFNNYEATYKCILSIAKNVKNINYELILVDDNSIENKQFFSSIKNFLLIHNDVNCGFLKSCNTAAEKASGEFLVFLNNDTEVTELWLSSIKETFDSSGNIGVVGSKLIYPDGRLQEAGGIIWRDGSGCNYGKFKNPLSSEFNYLRDVDYCSGASLATRKSLFIKLGLFDPRFTPAYYEDTDYCFKVRENDLRVVYQPESIVYHYEGLTSGNDIEKGTKAYQKKNQISFEEKWHDRLKSHYDPLNSFRGKYQAANNHGQKRTVLIIDSYMPCYDKESGSNRIFSIIKILRKLNYHVIFFPDNNFGEQPYTKILQQLGVETICREWCDSNESPIKVLKYRTNVIDFAWICRPQLFSKYFKYFKSTNSIYLIYDTIDLHFLRIKRQWEIEGKSNKQLESKWRKYSILEKRCSKIADLTITVTDNERRIVNDWGIKTAVVPNIHDISNKYRLAFKERSGILFIGSYQHTPNVDAVKWLCNEIMPLIWAVDKNIKLTLLGSNPTNDVLCLQSENVFVPGYIEDVEPFFNASKVFVAPLRYGAGMKGKVGHSLSLGLPVVSTSIGAEGMSLENGKNILIANCTNSISKSILSIYQNETEWSSISSKGLTHISKYSSENVRDKISSLLK